MGHMMKRTLTIALAVCSMAMVACKQTLVSESGLYNVELKRHPKVLADGIWTWGKGNPYARQKSGKIYIHPLDVSKVSREHAKASRVMVVQMHDYMVQSIAAELKELNKANKINWVLTTNPAEADVSIRTAIVKFVPQKPKLKAVSAIGSTVTGVPGVSKLMGIIADGNIVIEGTMRDARTGQLFLAFKDANRKTVRLYSDEAYTETGNADANLKEWAKNIASVVRLSAYDKLGNSTLQQKAEERSYFSVFSQAVSDSF